MGGEVTQRIKFSENTEKEQHWAGAFTRAEKPQPSSAAIGSIGRLGEYRNYQEFATLFIEAPPKY